MGWGVRGGGWLTLYQATPNQGGERVFGLQTPSSFSSQRSPEVQRADVDDSPSPGPGPGLFHSTPDPHALLDLDSSIGETPGPQPLSPDQRAPDLRCHTFNQSPSLYAEPVLSLTYTLPVSLLLSPSTLSLSASSLSPSASSLSPSASSLSPPASSVPSLSPSPSSLSPSP